MSRFKHDPPDVQSEQQVTPMGDSARSTHSDNQDFPGEVIGITIVGFFVGVVLSPFKGEGLVGFAASLAFTIWLIWSRRVRANE